MGVSRVRAASAGAVLLAGLSAVSLVSGAHAAETLDQQQLNVAGVPSGIGTLSTGPSTTADFVGAQTFTAGATGQFTRAELSMLRGDDFDTGALTVELRTVASGEPTSTVLASEVVAAASVPIASSGAAFIPVVFSPAVSIVSGTSYALVARTTTGTDYAVSASDTDAYAGGARMYADTTAPTTWLPSPGDWAFKTFVIPAAPAAPSTPAFDPACDENGVKTGFTVLKGTDGADKLTGTLGKDLIYGFGGNDVIQGRGGNDLVCAGAGNDEVIAGDDGDVVFGGAGNDRIRGGGGHDRLSGGDGNDVISGGDGRDRLHGNGGADVLRGNAGRDYLDGGTGADVLRGGDGDDTVKGGPGRDDVVS